MAKAGQPDTEQLLERVASGDQSAREQLLVRHRNRLKRTVSVRMDRRLAARLDPSDVVQDTLVDATKKLPQYLRERPVPFYAWLRQLAVERIVHEHRRHLRSKGRSLLREEQHAVPLPNHSAIELAVRLLQNGTGASTRAMREELQAKVQQVLAQLGPQDREILVLRFLEQLSTKEAAAVLGLTPEGIKTRQRRALEKFSRLLGEFVSGDQS